VEALNELEDIRLHLAQLQAETSALLADRALLQGELASLQAETTSLAQMAPIPVTTPPATTEMLPFPGSLLPPPLAPSFRDAEAQCDDILLSPLRHSGELVPRSRQLKQAVDDLAGQHTEAEARYGAARADQRKLQARCSDYSASRSTLQTRAAELSVELADLARQSEALQAGDVISTAMASLESSLSKVSARVTSAEAARLESTVQITSCEADIKMLKAKLSSLLTQQDLLQKDRRNLERTRDQLLDAR